MSAISLVAASRVDWTKVSIDTFGRWLHRRAVYDGGAPAARAQTQEKRAMKKLTGPQTDVRKKRQRAPLATPTDLASAATKDITAALNLILADVFAMYLKTKNFHWHMSGPHFRDYHLLLDEQADQIYAMADPVAERVRKLGGSTLRSIGHIARTQRVADNDADFVEPSDMLAELREDNKALASRLREAHEVCDEHHDIASASLIEVWIDETERRTWFLFEASRSADSSGH
jgi:starvation-inducible DNA-binding protein